jgi:8-oxo-dGTP diphosphatase / 2-hydroxy-dATP diphosphatase
MKKILTLGMVCGDGKILLGMKKRGFGEGRWNGFGGKVEEGETIEEGARRELQEEVGIEATTLEKVGVIDFTFENDPKELEVHIFKISDFSGTPEESEEMRPEWFPYANIPFEQMWPADVTWLPLLFEGKLFRGMIRFDMPSTAEYTAKILKQELTVVETLGD